jgi:hypothetical protein
VTTEADVGASKPKESKNSGQIPQSPPNQPSIILTFLRIRDHETVTLDSLSDRQKVALWGLGLAAPFAVATIILSLSRASFALDDYNPLYWLWIYLLFQAPIGLGLVVLSMLTPKGEDPLRRRSSYQPPFDD